MVLYGLVYTPDEQFDEGGRQLRHIATGESVAGPGDPSETTTKVTRALLACGVVAGPLFMVVALVQAFTHPKFNLKHHTLSILSLNDLG